MKNKLKVCFMGSPLFSVPSLKKLVSFGFEVSVVFTQEPKPANRGKKIVKQPIHIEAENMGIKIMYPKSLKGEEIEIFLNGIELDLIVVVAYGHILPKNILDIPKYGCINLHASLLPRWRGAAPIHRAIMAGDKKTGISIMLMSEGLDTGPLLSTLELDILEEDTISILSNKIANKGADLLVNTISEYINGSLNLKFQKNYGVTYANKINKNDQLIIWNKDASLILRQINALSPLPGAKCKIKDEIIKIISAELVLNSDKNSYGMIISDNLIVKCKKNALRILTLQRPGKKIMSAKEVLNGWPINKGQNMQEIILQ
tara:strand:- start:8049 stop:8996 length:948 start_codon:yes stop_codon:yes gene_type:complete